LVPNICPAVLTALVALFLALFFHQLAATKKKFPLLIPRASEFLLILGTTAVLDSPSIIYRVCYRFSLIIESSSFFAS